MQSFMLSISNLRLSCLRAVGKEAALQSRVAKQGEALKAGLMLCFCWTDSCHAVQAIDLKECDVYSYKSDGETDPFGE